MSNKISIAGIVLALVIAATSLGISVYNMNSSKEKSTSSAVESAKTAESTDNQADANDIQYVLFLGTNDKDTYEPYGDEQACKAKVDEVLSKHVEGFTIQDAMGGWTSEDGAVFHEYTIVILLSDTTNDKVHAICDDLIKTFNQSSVLIQENVTKTEFYSGQ